MSNEKTGRRGKKRIWGKDDTELSLLALPTTIWYLLFCFLPMFGIIIAFKNYKVYGGFLTSFIKSEWVGFNNFKFLFSSKDIWLILRNTLGYNVIFIILGIVAPVAAAIAVGQLHSKKLAKAYQTAMFMPYFLSWAVVAIVVNAFLHRSDGLVNHFIARMTGRSRPTDWYTVKSIWPPLLVAVNAWKSVGYSAVLYLAVISGISDEYYEAAVLDGASRWQQAKYITIPHLRFIISISIIMAMGNIFRGDFGLFYNVPMNSGRLYEVTDVIDTYIYRSLRVLNNVGMSTAAGLFQSAVGFFTLLLVNQIVRRIDPESSMF